MPQVIFAIPARYASTRLPGKPLLDLGGKPIVVRVLERAAQCAAKISGCRTQVLVATDDTRIAEVVRAAGYKACLTDPHLPSGTDRIYAAICQELALSDKDIIINIQGDEPFFPLEPVVELAAKMIADIHIPMGTLAVKKTAPSEFLAANVVKVITDSNGFAITFSRAPIPWPRHLLGASGTSWRDKLNFSEPHSFLHHIGVYAFQWQALKTFAAILPKGKMEEIEGLEQLRAVEAGWKIWVQDAVEAPRGIDTEEDLQMARGWIAGH